MTGVFCLRYDLAVSIFPTTSLGRWQSNLRHNSLDLRSSSLGSPPKARFSGETTGPPARCGRDCPAIRRTAFAGAHIVRPLPPVTRTGTANSPYFNPRTTLAHRGHKVGCSPSCPTVVRTFQHRSHLLPWAGATWTSVPPPAST